MATEPRHPGHRESDETRHPGRHENHETSASHAASSTSASSTSGSKPADDPLAQTKADAAKRYKDYQDRMKGRPTPTQDELNQIALGLHPELSDDGSGPDPNEATNTVRHLGAGRPGEYKTRDMAAR